MFFQVVSLVGAFCLLFAYVLIQTGRARPTDVLYGVLNLVGASLLGWVAVVDRRIGFIILEVVWAIASIPPLLRRPTSVNRSGS